MKPKARLDGFPAIFIKYLKEWNALDYELSRTPDWRMIKAHRLMNQMRTLTRIFTAQMKHRGIIE